MYEQHETYGDPYRAEWQFIARYWIPLVAALMVMVVLAWLAGPEGSPIARIEFADGAEYIGFVDRGLPHGEGTLVTRDGEIYAGRFVDGVRAGFGTCHYVNGDIYFGEWVGGRREGRGTLSYASGDTYTGQWLDDEPHGAGQRVLVDGEVLSGTWHHGAAPLAPRLSHDDGVVAAPRFAAGG